MLQKAYEPQCAAAEQQVPNARLQSGRTLILVALAFGTFVIGTGEFASMGILQPLSASLGLSIPTATNTVAAYAFGVVVGAPLLTVAAARLNRRTLLLAMVALFVAGYLFSAAATSLGMLVVARFISGLPQGAYFGAAAVVASYVVGPGRSGKAFALVLTGITVATIIGAPIATFLGQTLGWRATYVAVAGGALFALVFLWLFVPRTNDLRGTSLTQELGALKKGSVWLMMTVAALATASTFAVYTFIGPLITDVTHLSPTVVPFALALFGIGMTVGNLAGGKIADIYPARGLMIGGGGALMVLVILALAGSQAWILLPALFGVGATMMSAIPSVQVFLTRLAPEAPALMGAMNVAALNVANALGAWAGGIAIGAGLGLLSAAWAGFILTAAGLLLFALTTPRTPRVVPA